SLEAVSREDIQALTPVKLLTPTNEERTKLGEGIEFSSSTTHAGVNKNDTIRTVEEDAYTFQERFSNDIIQKLVQEQSQSANKNTETTGKSFSQEFEEWLVEEEAGKKKNKKGAKQTQEVQNQTQAQPKSLKALPGNIFGAFFEELDQLAKTTTKQFKTSLKDNFSSILPSVIGRVNKNAAKFAVNFAESVIDSIQAPEIEEAVEGILKAVFSPNQVVRELFTQKRSKQEIAAESVAFINEELGKVGKEQFALEPDKVKVLGAGVHSTVLGTSDADTRDLAYKTHPNLYESSVMQDLQSKGVSSVPKVHYVDENVMVSEKIKGKDLQSVLKQFVKDKENTNIEDLYQLARNLGSGLKQFHQGGYVHTDLHNQNMLVQSDLTPKFIDLEFARQTENEDFKTLERNNVIRRIEDVLRVGEGFQGNAGAEYIDRVKTEFLASYQGDSPEPIATRPRTAINDFIDSASEIGVRGKVDEIADNSAKGLMRGLGQNIPPQLIEGIQNAITGFAEKLTSVLTKLVDFVKSEFDKRTAGIKEKISGKINEYLPSVVRKDIEEKQRLKQDQRKQQIAKYLEQGTTPLKEQMERSRTAIRPYTSSFVLAHEQAKERSALGIAHPVTQAAGEALKPTNDFLGGKALQAAQLVISEEKAQETLESLKLISHYFNVLDIQVNEGSNSVEHLFNLITKMASLGGNLVEPLEIIPTILEVKKEAGLLKNYQREFDLATAENPGKYASVVEFLNEEYITRQEKETEAKVSKFPVEHQDIAREKIKEGMANYGMAEVIGQVPVIRDLVIKASGQQKTKNIQQAVEEIKREYAEKEITTTDQKDGAETKVYTIGGFAADISESGKMGHDLADHVKIATGYDPKVDVQAFENIFTSDPRNKPDLLTNNIAGKINPDSLRFFKQIYADHLANPKQKQVIVSHSAGGFNAQDILEMAVAAGIPLQGIGIGTPKMNANAVERLNQKRYQALGLNKDPVVNSTLGMGKLAGFDSKQDQLFKGETHSMSEFFGRKDSNEAVLKLIYGKSATQSKERLGIGLYRKVPEMITSAKLAVQTAKEIENGFVGIDPTPELQNARQKLIDYLNTTIKYISSGLAKLPQEIQAEISKELEQVTSIRNESASLQLQQIQAEVNEALDVAGFVENIFSGIEVETPEIISNKEKLVNYLTDVIENTSQRVSSLPEEMQEVIAEQVTQLEQTKSRFQGEAPSLPPVALSVPESRHENAISEINRVLQTSPNLQLQPESTKLLGKGSQGAVFGTTGQDKRKLAYKFVEQQEAETLKGLQNLNFVPKLIHFKDSLLVHEQVIGNTLAEVASNLDRESLSNAIVKNA
ncbi:MAG TPA: RIO1 family regulatory kinase/ATPase, partial [Phormidium sp.]